MTSMLKTIIPADLAASTARVRALVEGAGLGRDMAEAEQRARDTLSRDCEALAKIGAPLYDRMVEWKAAGLTAKQIASRPVQARYALNPHLQELVDNQKLSFEDVFELYAVLCIEQVRDMVNDMMEDEGVTDLIKNGMSLTVRGLSGSSC